VDDRSQRLKRFPYDANVHRRFVGVREAHKELDGEYLSTATTTIMVKAATTLRTFVALTMVTTRMRLSKNARVRMRTGGREIR